MVADQFGVQGLYHEAPLIVVGYGLGREIGLAELFDAEGVSHCEGGRILGESQGGIGGGTVRI